MKKMKTFKNLLLAAFILATFSLSAQFVPFGSHTINGNNPGFVGIGTMATPTVLLDVNRFMTEPTIAVRNTGSNGGATFQMVSFASGADWKFKATNSGGFKIRDNAFGLDVITIAPNSANNAIYVGSNGVIGMHTSTPWGHGIGAKLDIRGGDIYFEDANAFLQINNTLTDDNTGIFFSEDGTPTIWFWYDGNNDFLRLTAGGGGFGDDFILHSTGEIGIGTTTIATGYQMMVAGKVACEEVLVQLQASWPDYVFDEDYDLMSLEQLEESIEQNSHLPGVPSAAEVEENGLTLGEMQRVFLEKLEELTLYTIEQGKQIKAQQQRIEVLEQENRKLRK